MKQNWWAREDLEIVDGMDRVNRWIAKHGREEFDAHMSAWDQIAKMIKEGNWPPA